MSLRNKMIIYLGGVFFLTGIVFATILSNHFKNNYLQELQHSFILQEKAIGKLLFKLLKQNKFKEINKITKDLGKNLQERITIILPAGKVIGDSQQEVTKMDNHKNRIEVIQALNYGKGQSIRYSKTLQIKMFYVACLIKDKHQPQAIIRIALPLYKLENSLNKIQHLITTTFLLVFILALIIIWRLIEGFAKPIKKLSDSALKIAQGNLEEKIFLTSTLEMKNLSQSLNLMTENLKDKITEIHQQKDKIENILLQMHQGIIVLNDTQEIVFFNSSAEEIFNLKASLVLNKNIFEALLNKEIKEYLDKVLLKKEFFSTEIKLTYPQEKYLKIHCNLIKESAHSNLLILEIINISDLKKLEKVREDFVANVSHELYTPLTALKAIIESLRAGAVEDLKVREQFLVNLEKETNRLINLVQDLLELVRAEKKENKTNKNEDTIKINVVIQEVIEKLKPITQEKNILVENNSNNDLPAIKLNKQDALAIFINLLSNALKYNTQNGKVIITGKATNKEIQISIADTGIGIPSEDLPRIFERFYRVDKMRSREEGGTGLGLSIVKHLVEQNNGKIWAESELNKGSKFFVVFFLN